MCVGWLLSEEESEGVRVEEEVFILKVERGAVCAESGQGYVRFLTQVCSVQ